MPAFEEILDCLDITHFMLEHLQVKQNLLAEAKYDLLFSVERVNELVVQGVPRQVSVLTDPCISYAVPSAVPRYTVADLPPRIDYVVLTHAHADHLMLETLLQLRGRIGTIVAPASSGGRLVDPSLKLLLRAVGFRRVVELEELEELAVPGGSITGIPFFGEHSDLEIRAKIAHMIQLEGRGLLLAADSNAIEPRVYDHVRAAIGPVDALFIGMESEGGPMSRMYGPR